MKLTITNISTINATAKQILALFPDVRIFALQGDMGAGKTTLIKALCKEIGVADAMSSPTYAIVNHYQDKNTVYHIDLYRLKDIKEAFSIGIEEYLNSGNYCFIEWPEIIEPLLPKSTVTIKILVNNDDSRELAIEKI